MRGDVGRLLSILAHVLTSRYGRSHVMTFLLPKLDLSEWAQDPKVEQQTIEHLVMSDQRRNLSDAY